MPSPSALHNIRPISQLCYLIVTLHGGCRSPSRHTIDQLTEISWTFDLPTDRPDRMTASG